MAAGIWDRLPPDEFKQLQEYTKYSKRRLKDVLTEFREGLYKNYDPEQPIGYEGFKMFMSAYLGNQISDELCQTLFWTFHKKVPATADVNASELPNALLKKFLSENGNTHVEHFDDPSLTRIAKGARRATVVATATVVAGIQGAAATDHNVTESSNNIALNSSIKSNRSYGNDNLTPGDLNSKKSSSEIEISVSHFENNDTNKSYSFDDSTKLKPIKEKTSTNLLSNSSFVPMIEIKEIACYLSLLEGGEVQDKLEFVFRVYDSDMNNFLDQQELESIVSQMIRVAEYLGWDTSVLKPIFRTSFGSVIYDISQKYDGVLTTQELRKLEMLSNQFVKIQILTDMLAEMDFDADGQISMEEWIKGGMNNIPFLVLLGMDVKVDEEGRHQQFPEQVWPREAVKWQMKHFKTQAYCNLCHSQLTGFGRKQGLQCIFCRYTCHERCVNRVPHSCIQTYTETKSKRKKISMDHHWVEGNCPGKCTKCNKNIKNNCLTGLHCVWCQSQVHNRCAGNMPTECSLGPHKVHILPPICITPQTKKVKEEISKEKKNSVISYDGIPMLISPLPNTQPLVVFVNPKSGGRQGARLLNKFRYILNPRQVFNLADGGPLPGLKFFSQVPNFRVLCCGGDGTAGWILSTIDRLTSIKQRPAMSILPLGTGNDLARCLSWGGGYDGGSIDKYLYKTSKSTVVSMDRWQIECEETSKNDEADVMPQSIMNNYFSIGVDAAIALKFHLQREKSPEKFNSRFKNKLRYFEAGTSEQLAASCKGLHNDIEIICDGKKLELPSLEGIAILNIPSIYGGADIWGEPEKSKRKKKVASNGDLGVTDLCYAVQDISDKKVEVVGLENSLYVGQIIAGVRQHGLRLAQCSNITLKVKRTLPMQVDGEPWMQAPAELSIRHKNQTPMCVAPSNTKRGFFGFFSKKSHGESS